MALATNMISVGLDITRLGLMVVLGQPKTHAEYIQATSRVGRDDERPGPRRHAAQRPQAARPLALRALRGFHETFYRAVEATSVTPFSPRALDRGAGGGAGGPGAAGLVQALTPATGAVRDRGPCGRQADFVAQILARRAQAHDRDLDPAEAQTLAAPGGRAAPRDLLDAWSKIAQELARPAGAGLQY